MQARNFAAEQARIFLQRLANGMQVLLTRPKEDSESLAALLKARGIKSLIEPMLTIYPRTNVRLLIDDIQALIFTSANGVRSLAEATTELSLIHI